MKKSRIDMLFVARINAILAFLLLSIVLIFLLFTFTFLIDVSSFSSEQPVAAEAIKESVKPVEKPKLITHAYFNRDFDTEKLDDAGSNVIIKKGYEIINQTHIYLGPNSDNPYTGNNLDCKSCHLDAGTKPFSAPYVGVTGRYPQYRGREDRIGSIEDRINGCMERSMNGKALPHDSPEMKAMVAYMEWLSKDVPKEEKIKGSGFLAVNYPNRKVDLDNGKKVYSKHCVVCHGEDALGKKKSDGGYTYPALAGDDTYNHGAGMHRVLTATQFIKSNMPLGATAENPILTDEEAFDVAGYINSLDRPKKSNTDVDFPKKEKKPMSTPYGPWADDFSAEQHKYGPFQEIKTWYEKVFKITKTK